MLFTHAASWLVAETPGEKDHGVRGAAQSAQEREFPEEKKYNTVLSAGR